MNGGDESVSAGFGAGCLLFDDAAFDDQTVGVRSFAVHAAQGGFIVCVEEILLRQGGDFVVDEVQHGLVALLHGRCDCIQTAQRFDAFVLDRYLGNMKVSVIEHA